MATTVATWPRRYQVEDKPQASVFEPFKEFFRMLVRGCFPTGTKAVRSHWVV